MASLGIILRERLRPFLGVSGSKKLYFYAVIVGVFSGLAATLFTVGLSWAEVFTQGYLAGHPATHPEGAYVATHLHDLTYRPWVFFFLPVIGGLLSGLMTYWFAPEAGGHGTDALIDAFHNNEGKIRTRIPYVKAIATIFTLSGGGSAGKEGPLAQVGAGFGAWWADFCGLGSRARRSLLLAGAAAGLGAIFRSPLGGAVTAVEVLYREDFESDAFIPCVISSVTGYTVISAFLGGDHLFAIGNDIHFGAPLEVLLYTLLGVICLPFSWLYVRFFYGVRDRLLLIPLPSYMIPMLGGVVVGSIGLYFPEVLGSGTGYLQHLIMNGNDLPWWKGVQLFAGLAALKVLSTSFTVGAGASGGVFAPSLFIGGMLGALVGTLGQHVFPDTVTSIAPYMLVGMGAFFTGIANAPLASLLMVSEMTGGYALIAPMMAVGIISSVLSHRWSIYEKQVHNRFDSPAHLWDMKPDILRQQFVRDLVNNTKSDFSSRAIVRNDMLLFSLEAHAEKLHASDFIIIDEQQHYVGVVSLRDTVVHSGDDPFLRNIVMLQDVAVQAPTVSPDDNLRKAMAAVLKAGMDKVAVVENNKVLGYLSTRDILRAYEGAVRAPGATPEPRRATIT